MQSERRRSASCFVIGHGPERSTSMRVLIDEIQVTHPRLVEPHRHLRLNPPP